MVMGRPRVIESPAWLYDKFEEYKLFVKLGEQEEVVTPKGDIVQKKVTYPPTVLGFCVWLGITTATLSNYASDDEFFDTITRIKEECNVGVLNKGFTDPRAATMAKFVLGNTSSMREQSEVRHGNIDGETMVIENSIASARAKLNEKE